MNLTRTRALAALTLAAALLAGARAAAPSVARADSAVMISDAGACFVLDGYGQFVNVARGGTRLAGVTGSGGSVSGYCSATVAPAADGQTRIYSGQSTGRDCTLLVNGRLTVTRTW